MPITATTLEQRIPPRSSGASRQARSFTPTEINHIVDLLLTVDLSNVRNCVLELLYQFVALSETTLFRLVSRQIAISEKIETFTRKLRKYRSEGLLAGVSQDVIKNVLRAGLPSPEDSGLRAYTLGPVGEEYVRRKGWNGNVPVSTINEDALTHDLICAETMIRMSQLWLTHPTSPGIVEVRGPREVVAWDTKKKVAIVAPDGLLHKRAQDGTLERAFLVEYQNVRSLLQVQNKLKKYEEIAKTEYRWIWRDVWGMDTLPYILVIHRQGSTLRFYQEEIAIREEMAAQFASISLEDVWAGNLLIETI